ncbi:FUSC family protein [Novosphingobium sp. KACC 22771]|uniref:FUSC family protein n=1 Tax=Novosphingobium sp. KACC 22771 TaxID=3025670 RepID=UPI002365C803|nr:FUSC family protein [Novosphingobium sp. KACC 22771]WDF74816.1 FUSC family protein [Novosphingobium sp. KACC 22771]
MPFALPSRNRLALAQTLRVMIACLATYWLASLLGLKQGYWAIFTVLIVMQGSLGATATAAFDRLIATIAGALLGGVVVMVVPREPLATGAALICMSGILTYAAVRQPRLRSAALTSAIVLLTRSPDIPVGIFVIDRIIEITLGGAIGVMASRFILPVPSRGAMITRFCEILETMAQLLNAQADAVARGEALISAEASIALRQSLVATEAVLNDARRERAMGLVREDVSDAIPRTLWRIRNGMAQIGLILRTPFPPSALALVGPAVEGMLRAHAQSARDAASALSGGGVVAQHAEAAEAFEQAFVTLQHSDEARAIPFDAMGQVFGMAFALRRMQQDFLDLGERIAECR